MIAKPSSKKISKQEEKLKEIVKAKSLDEIKDSIKSSDTGFDARYILRRAEKEMEDLKQPKKFTSDTNYYKAMTLFEFDKGVLLINSLPELFRVFALEFSKNLQSEFKCTTASEKSLAEVTSLNFIRTLWIQDRIRAYLGIGSITDTGVKYLDVLSKELDRANRHYLNSLQTLKMIKQPILEVNIKTQTAVVGQNQIVQSNNK